MKDCQVWRIFILSAFWRTSSTSSPYMQLWDNSSCPNPLHLELLRQPNECLRCVWSNELTLRSSWKSPYPPKTLLLKQNLPLARTISLSILFSWWQDHHWTSSYNSQPPLCTLKVCLESRKWVLNGLCLPLVLIHYHRLASFQYISCISPFHCRSMNWPSSTGSHYSRISFVRNLQLYLT